ncbi:MAG: bifunctional riboflavin kinase/FAD synthetase, partial [Myxococcales bacterium]
MQIWRHLSEVPSDLGPTVVTIGNFDGVHRGHQHVVAKACEVGARDGLTVVAVTFDPHPLRVLRPDVAPSMLTSVEQRAALLGEAGADAVLVLPFDRELSSWTADEFIDRVLVDGLGARAVVVGENFRFGAKAAGHVDTLVAHGGFEVIGLPLDGGPETWSSTYVRGRIAEGDVAAAAEALGRPPAVCGPVVRGDQRGRELGFPTANVAIGDVLAPADGVYAGWLRRLDTDERFPAAISVGTNPTFEGERSRRVEAYVLDRTDLDLYDVQVEISFVDRLRGMVAFEGPNARDDLVATMHDD